MIFQTVHISHHKKMFMLACGLFLHNMVLSRHLFLYLLAATQSAAHYGVYWLLWYLEPRVLAYPGTRKHQGVLTGGMLPDAFDTLFALL